MNISPIKSWLPESNGILVIAGPCSAETESQLIETATRIKNFEKAKMFRAGVWKPRTRPNSFEGLGEIALPWLKRVKEETGLKTTVEVANASHVELALKYDVDALWIGARTTASPFAVQEIAESLKGVKIPVLIKNPINPDLQLWIGAIERLYQSGNSELVAIHRGFSMAGETTYRNSPMWKIPIELKKLIPSLPIICDPSHITGKRSLIEKVTQKALDLSMDGLMIETHITPEKAWSDSAQQITPEDLDNLLNNLSYKNTSSSNKEFECELDRLRLHIDRIDEELMDLLYERLKIVERVADEKIRNNVTALQIDRLTQMIQERLKKGLSIGLSKDYIKDIFDTIHTESVKIQTDIMKSRSENQFT